MSFPRFQPQILPRIMWSGPKAGTRNTGHFRHDLTGHAWRIEQFLVSLFSGSVLLYIWLQSLLIKRHIYVLEYAI